MRISDLLRWGPKKEEGEAASQPKPGPQTRKTQSFWKLGGSENAQPAHVPEGPCAVHWKGADGERCRQRSIVSASEPGEGVIRLRNAVPAGSAVWVALHGGTPSPATVRDCVEVEGGLQVVLDFDLSVERQEGSGSVQVQWIDAQGRLISTPASIRNARAEGVIEGDAAHALPAGSLALLAGGEVCCLGEILSCEPAEGTHRVEILAVAEASTARAAA